MKLSPLPQAFAALTGKVDYVQRWTQDEWSSSCPQCGGAPHKDGSRPDRFRMWTNATGKNKVMGWCRRCSYVWFPDGDKKLSPAEFEEWRREQVRVETLKKEAAEKALQLLNSEKIWQKYHEQLFKWDIAVNEVKSWMVPKAYAEYWQIGFAEDFIVYQKDGEPYHSPAISIPVWRPQGKISNVKMRVLNPKSNGDRYRSLYKTGSAKPFVAWRNFESDTVMVVEGEKKCMTTAYQCRKLGVDIQLYGMPSKTPDEAALRELDGYKEIFLCLDPDASEKVNGVSALGRMIDILGRERVRVVTLPGKVDDMIIQNGLNIKSALRYAK